MSLLISFRGSTVFFGTKDEEQLLNWVLLLFFLILLISF
jgi:hypothetical protein